MANVNFVCVEGTITKDAEITAQQSNQNGQNQTYYIVSFSIAYNTSKLVNGKWEQGAASFFNCSWFPKSEKLAQRLRKGCAVVVSGVLKQERWVDQNDQNRSAIKIIVKSNPAIIQKATSTETPPVALPANNSSPYNSSDEDIPF